MKPVIASVLLSTLLFGVAQGQDMKNDPKCGVLFWWTMAVQTQALVNHCGWERNATDDAIDRLVSGVEVALRQSPAPAVSEALAWKVTDPLPETPYNCDFDPEGSDGIVMQWNFRQASATEMDAALPAMLAILAGPESSSCF